MTLLHTLGFYLHILAGSMALLSVWIPMTVKKGSLDHKKFGRYYHNTMMTVAASGALIATIVIIDPMQIHGFRLDDPSQADTFISRMRVFYSLLLFLSLVIYVGLTHGKQTLKSKMSNQHLKKWSYLLPNILLLIASVPLFIAGYLHNITLAMIFPFLGLALAIGHINFIMRKHLTSNAWLEQHISAYIGTAIGAYTAFIAFGGRTLFSDIGQWQLLFWVLPGVLGSFIIRHFCAKYAPKTALQRAKNDFSVNFE